MLVPANLIPTLALQSLCSCLQQSACCEDVIVAGARVSLVPTIVTGRYVVGTNTSTVCRLQSTTPVQVPCQLAASSGSNIRRIPPTPTAP
jgi:hypothetical protein